MGSRKMTRKRRARFRERAEKAERRRQFKRDWAKKKEEREKELITRTRKRWDWTTTGTVEALVWKNWKNLPVPKGGWFRDFASVLKTTGSEEYRKKLGALLLTVQDRNRYLIECASFFNYGVLAFEDWLRPVETWKPKGKSERAHYRSLIDHLLVRYPVPEFLYQLADLDFRGWNGISFFARIAGGDRVVDCFNGGFLPIPMTKRMCHRFMQMPAGTLFFEAIRRAQVEVLGGEKRLADAVCRTFLGRGAVSSEDFWLTVIRWFCRQPDVDLVQVGPLFDYVKSRHEEDPGYSIKGRTFSALIRGMEEWHRYLAREKAIHGVVFEPSGFRSGTWELIARNGKSGKRYAWTMEEVLTAKVLLEEGNTMKHCVYSYVPHIKKGDTSIWSLKREGVRALTVEVLKGKRTVEQARGKHNRLPRKYELSVLKRWAKENMLKMDIRWQF